jgi:hypothetical protein
MRTQNGKSGIARLYHVDYQKLNSKKYRLIATPNKSEKYRPAGGYPVKRIFQACDPCLEERPGPVGRVKHDGVGDLDLIKLLSPSLDGLM